MPGRPAQMESHAPDRHLSAPPCDFPPVATRWAWDGLWAVGINPETCRMDAAKPCCPPGLWGCRKCPLNVHCLVDSHRPRVAPEHLKRGGYN